MYLLKTFQCRHIFLWISERCKSYQRVVVFTLLHVIKCTPLIKLQIECVLLIHKIPCMVQPNQFNQEICPVIKAWVREAEAWLCFPVLVSQHQSRLQKISPFTWPWQEYKRLVLSRGLWWSMGSSLSCCVEQLPFCRARVAVTFREICRAAFLQMVTLESILGFFLVEHLWYQCWFEREQQNAVLWPFRISLLEKHPWLFLKDKHLLCKICILWKTKKSCNRRLLIQSTLVNNGCGYNFCTLFPPPILSCADH